MSKATILSDDEHVVADEDLRDITLSLRTLARSFNKSKLHEQMLRDAGVRLDRAGATLLFQLHAAGHGSCRVTELAELLKIDPPAVTRKIQQLERLGYVARESDDHDKRASRIKLTPSGEAIIARLTEVQHQRLARHFSEWSPSDVTAFRTLLGRFAQTLKNEMETLRD